VRRSERLKNAKSAKRSCAAADRKTGHGEKRLGLTLEWKKSNTSLGVVAVKEGLVADWNAAHPAEQVREGDRIVEVNGLRGNNNIVRKVLLLGHVA